MGFTGGIILLAIALAMIFFGKRERERLCRSSAFESLDKLL
jgi:hypothetical protein